MGIALKYAKMTKSKKTPKTGQKFYNKSVVNNISFHMLLDHCYTFDLSLLPSNLKQKFFEERYPRSNSSRPILALPWICP